MKPQDELIERYHQAKTQLPDELPKEPPTALHERIMRAAYEQPNATNSIAPRANSTWTIGPKDSKNTIPNPEAANDSFWSIKAVASLAVMGLSALLWWQFEQGTPESQEAVKSAQPSPAVVAIAPTTTPATNPPSEALSDSTRVEKNVSASVPKPASKPAPASIAQQAEAASAAPPLAAQRSRADDTTAAPQTANAEAAITSDTSERSAAAKGVQPAQASKRFSPEAQDTSSASPTAAPSAAAPPPITAPTARAAAAPMAIARPPLIVALQERDAAALRQALAQGASPNLRTPDGNPALTQAVIQRWTEGVRIMLAAGADRNAKNNKGHTAADVALELGFADMTELLAMPK